MRALAQIAFAVAVMPLVASRAPAFELSSMTLPMFAASPQFGEKGLSPWGYAFDSQPWSFSRTSPNFATTQNFAPIKGTNFLLGVQSSAGTLSDLAVRGPALGYDFSSTSVKLGYNMGRLVPYVEVNSAFAKPSFAAPGMPFSAPGDPYMQSREGRGVTSLKAGFDYAVTDRFSFGVSVSAGTAR